MEITINLDLPGIISAAVTAERLQPLVDKAINEALKNAINEATGYRSPFREELKKQLAEAMPHGLAIDDCAKFQQMLNRAVTETVSGANAQTIQTAMREMLKAVVPEVPERIKLSEFMEEARRGFHKEDHEAFYALYEPSEYGGGHLYLDRDEDHREKYRADIRLAFTEDGTIYSLVMGGKEITPNGIPNAIGGFNGLLLAMYVGRTSLEVDIDADDVEYAAHAKYD